MTDREKSREQLLNELKTMRRLVESSPDAFFIQSDGKLVFANEAGARLLGADNPEELIGKQIIDVVSPKRWKNVQELVDDFLEDKTVRIQKKFIRLDGTAVDVEVAAIPFNYNGKPAMQLVAHDISQRVKAETALRESEERYRDLFENANDLIQSISVDGRFIYANNSWLKALGYTEDELSRLNFVEIIHPDCLAHCVDCYQRVMAGESLLGIEAIFITKDGRMLEVEGSITPHLKSGKVVATRGIFRDITERKRSQEELLEKDQRIQKELQLANTIQSSLFPVNLPQIPGATLAATAVPANEVGGDYCDLFITKTQKLGIAIGDVMGKGVPAALFMAMTYAFVRNYALEAESPSAVVNKVNRSLFPQLEFAEQFITFFYSIYNPETRELLYTNAGHNPPLVYRAENGECEYLKVRDFFVGGKQDAEYREGSTILNPGDVVLFYTDGLKEGQNTKKEQFGMERIKNLLKESSVYDPASIQELISFEFNEFLAGEPPYDDVTMVVIKIDS